MKYRYKDLDLELIYNYKPQNKHTYLRAKGNIVTINSFKRFNEADVNRFLESVYPKLKVQIKREEVITSKRPSIHIFGVERLVITKIDSFDDVSLINDNIIIHTTNMDYSYNKMLVYNYYANLLKKFLDDNYKKILAFFPEIKIPPTIHFNTMKTAYGKYNKKDNSITLAVTICKYHFEYIKLIIAHELTHCLYMNHQDEFYRRLNKVIPNAKRYQHMLRKIQYNDYF